MRARVCRKTLGDENEQKISRESGDRDGKPERARGRELGRATERTKEKRELTRESGRETQRELSGNN